MLSTALATLIYLLFFSVRLYLPDTSSSSFAIKHYVVGAAIAMVLGLIPVLRSASTSTILQQSLGISRNLLAFVIIIFLHTNFKLWAQLVNTELYDQTYQAIDDWLSPLINAITFVNNGFEPLKEAMPFAYHDVFAYMFFSTFIAFSLHKKSRPYCEELLVCISLILVIGGISYAIAPAWGPFIYEFGNDPVAWGIQQNMAQFQLHFNASAGMAYAGQNFISALGAMPSLHSAHTLALWMYARRHIPWLGYIYLPCLIFILTEAIASKWHYLIDLIAGVALTALCILLAGKICARFSPSSKAADIRHL